MKTILLTGGGTAGHVTPNLALFRLSRQPDMIFDTLVPTMVWNAN